MFEFIASMNERDIDFILPCMVQLVVHLILFRREERDGLSRREDRREGNVNIDVAESSSITSDEGTNRFNHR